MKDFIEWCFDVDSPMWVTVLAMTLTVISMLSYIFVGIAFASSGYGVVAVVMFFVVPVYALVCEYLKSKGKL